MTVVVAIKDNGRVAMVGDQQMTNDYLRVSLATPKVFKVGRLVIGVSGSPAVATALRHRFACSGDRPVDLDHFAQSPIRDAVIAALEGGGLLRTVDGVASIGPDEDGARLLVAFGDRFWEVQANLAVVEHAEPFAAIGSGAECAYGALWASRVSGWSPAERAVLAVRAAGAYVNGCGGCGEVVWTDGEDRP